ncbi:hypothetical protein DAEQUDRAFT_585294 [Daedalea quercina L-15889]|uniref:Uncharacterized protein n=1 Tax=Daedalea quercina L-15889 TaxID=1314783 RepID=A0A165LQP9_9APHY|nr:hypothetical protein DAEQUDRAFT_585294 [Daedalea quercina L-15889]
MVLSNRHLPLIQAFLLPCCGRSREAINWTYHTIVVSDPEAIHSTEPNTALTSATNAKTQSTWQSTTPLAALDGLFRPLLSLNGVNGALDHQLTHISHLPDTRSREP